ncbi:MAG: RNA polymerase sigma factor [Planctomycetota bacterium]
MLSDLSTNFVGRLRARDPAAWFELWENFGPILRAQLARWGQGRIGRETVQDLSQETLAALAGAIDRHDPTRGARFSTWLLAIARHTLGDEIDRRMAQKRGAGERARSLEGIDGEMDGGAGRALAPDAAYERAVFDAKVAAALRAAERECGFEDFTVFRLRVLQGQSGREVARALGTSESTVSRRLAGVRERVRQRLQEVFAKYSFTPGEWEELSRNGLDLNPKKRDEASFDEAVAEIYHRLSQRMEGGSETGALGGSRTPKEQAW